MYIPLENRYIWIFSISLLQWESKKSVSKIVHCITFTAKSHLAPTTKKKRTDSNSRNHWHIQSEVLIRSLLGWASSCILLESLFLCTSLRYLGTGVTQMPDRKDRWVKPLESSPGSSSDCSLSPQAFSSTKCQMCHRFSSHCLKRFGYVPPLPSLIFLVNYSK